MWLHGRFVVDRWCIFWELIFIIIKWFSCGIRVEKTNAAQRDARRKRRGMVVVLVKHFVVWFCGENMVEKEKKCVSEA